MKKTHKKIGATVAGLGFFASSFKLVFAQGGTTGSMSVQITNPIGVSSFSGFASLVTKTAVDVLLPFLVLAFIYTGFLFVKAQGNEKGLEEAKNSLWYSMIGAFILFGAWGFAQIIGQTVSTITTP